MKTEWNVIPVPLGFSFSAQTTAYNLGLHRRVFSVSNPRTRKGKWARGGGFLVHHQTSAVTPVHLPEYTYLGWKHGGYAVPVGSVTSRPASIPGSYASPTYAGERTTLLPWGTKGWARARPGNAQANAFQFAYELKKIPTVPVLGGPRDRILQGGLRGLPGRMLNRLLDFRRLGSEYLNVVFGWLPFVKDLQEMYKLTLDIDERIRKLRRDNGRIIHRERRLVDTTTVSVTESTVNGPFAYLLPTPIIIGGGRTRRTVTSSYKEQIWFEGAFRYYVPNIGSLEWEKRAKRALFGANVTPVNVWKVLPWSWLIDWFANTSDVLSNMSENAVDNTVAKYAYVMRTTERDNVTVIQTDWGGRSGAPATYPAGGGLSVLRESTITKSRIPATPYGFGLTTSGLSPYRIGVLAALGMSQGRFSGKF